MDRRGILVATIVICGCGSNHNDGWGDSIPYQCSSEAITMSFSAAEANCPETGGTKTHLDCGSFPCLVWSEDAKSDHASIWGCNSWRYKWTIQFAFGTNLGRPDEFSWVVSDVSCDPMPTPSDSEYDDLFFARVEKTQPEVMKEWGISSYPQRLPKDALAPKQKQ